jgi:hypothetical protein
MLTYGLRWEVNPPPTGGLFTVSGLDNPATMTLAPQGTPLWETTYGNFAPRVGLAYDLSQRRGRETVLRGGFGIFYDLGAGWEVGNAPNGGPNSRSKLVFNVLLPPNPSQVAPPPFSLDPPYALTIVFDPNLQLPRTYQWNFNVEQSLGSNQTISAAYVGATGRRLLRQEQLFNPNPNFQRVDVTRSNATSDYNAMQLQFQRRLSRGLQTLASYTWSHSIDTASNDSASNTPSAIIDPRQDRGPSDFDIRHTFSAAVTYDIPSQNLLGAVGSAFLRNWGIDTIITARSATPVNVVTGTAILGVADVFRPDLNPGAPLYLDDPTVGGGRRINRAAFAIPPAGRQGTLGRNALRGFPMWQVDLALRRQFNLTERVNLQLRAEFFNIFNHPNFADPISPLNNPLFGESVQMLGRSLGGGGAAGGFNPLYQVGGPRSVQLALKLVF